MNPLIAALEGTLIVSCQAYPGEPMRHPDTMARVAAAVEIGGASAVRAQGVDDVRAVRARVSVPVIGIWKDGTSGVVITPTLRHALGVAAAGADIVALDATLRPRPDGLSFAETVAGLRAEFPDVAVMADCDDVDSALAAAAVGVELVGTTLAGYTPARAATDGPDLALLAELARRLPGVPVVGEGRVHTLEQARQVRAAGAFATVVGTAITHPSSITRWFVEAATGSS